MPPSGYQPLAQDDDLEAGDLQASISSLPFAAGSKRRHRPGPIDLSKIDGAFKRWTDNIAQKIRRKKKAEEIIERKEIAFSVFPPYTAVPGPSSAAFSKTLDHNPPLTKEQYAEIIKGVKEAILEGIHPKMIAKGSSGSYFAKAREDGRVKTVAVFKPKDEEPYGRLNPKTTKWLHRQLRWILPFGRACLIPNLSYISEAAASLMDTRLGINIVPRTELVSLSSPSFFYDWIDRNAAKKGKPLPEKIGSMQWFLHGYQDASTFLREHPWPGRAISDTFDDSTHRTGGATKRVMSALNILCGKAGDEEGLYDEDEEDDQMRATYDDNRSHEFYWSATLQQDFRQELEKLVILDYLISNTDRGSDNYMIKYCEANHDQLVSVAPSRMGTPNMPFMTEVNRPTPTPSSPPRSTSPRQATSTSLYSRPHLHLAAIDNSLSFPHEHPGSRGWRSYTPGWLYLPISLIGRPFSDATRKHFLPLLSSKEWWEETTLQLRQLFAVDPDFHPQMFARQLAVMKGQAWNIVNSLKHSDEGPLELTRRIKVLIWDDVVEVAETFSSDEVFGPMSADLPGPYSRTNRHERRVRSMSASDFPPPLQRTSTDITGITRPVPFSAKFKRINPAATGVSVLEHLERLDAVEAGLQRAAIGESVIEEEGEDDHTRPSSQLANGTAVASASTSQLVSDQRPLRISTQRMSHDHGSREASGRSIHSIDQRGGSLDWIRGGGDGDGSQKKRTVIIERLETVNTKSLCSCW